jgi:2',3'-cyclic-nucleotide 2'-phosphodiesterase (5'-nucleotidase family)
MTSIISRKSIHNQRLKLIVLYRDAEIKGGAARFVTAFDKYNSREKLTLFSGDLFSPSTCKHTTILYIVYIVSTFYKGEQMIDIFNRLNVRASCIGNHDFVSSNQTNNKHLDRTSEYQD